MGKRITLIEVLKVFKNSVSSNLPIEKMLFFGSMASGKAGKWSDTDLIVVSKSFNGKRPLDRGRELYAQWKLDRPVDFLCYTPEEFKESIKKIGIASHALKHGIAI
ncbi:nucleotidyltransferase domain-containing protein [Candidatus Micrarchaeota archaeon]|nr:nucleotidyltransferase domain-containing protein [Candidatus Micrarchaeota archaeon]